MTKINCISWEEILKLAKGFNFKQNEISFANRNSIKECLYKLQNNLEITSAQDIVDKLELLSWKANLKYMNTNNGNTTEIFVSSDMFYIEIQIEMCNGNINTVKIAHNNGEPVFSEDLWNCLKSLKFKEFLFHLNGINQLYQISADKKQKAKIYLALNSLENDLLELYKLQNTITDLYMLVTRAPLGYVTHRHGGLPMSFTFYLTPYALISCKTKKISNLTLESLSTNNIGLKVLLNIRGSDNGSTHKLQTSPVLTLITSPEGKVLPHFAALNNQNSSILNACFCLEFDETQDFMLSLPLVKKIQMITGINVINLNQSNLSYTNHLINVYLKNRKTVEGKKNFHRFFVKLPGAKGENEKMTVQLYTFARDEGLGNVEGEGMKSVLVKRVPFTHPTHIPQILMVLRQQALSTSLLQTCLRYYQEDDNSNRDFEGSEVWPFDIYMDSPDYINIIYTNPKYQSVVKIEINVSDMSGIKIKLYTSNCDSAQISNLAAKMESIIQKSVSIPLALRTFSYHIIDILSSECQAVSKETQKLDTLNANDQSVNNASVKSQQHYISKKPDKEQLSSQNAMDIVIKPEPMSETASEKSWPPSADRSKVMAQLENERPSSCPTAFATAIKPLTPQEHSLPTPPNIESVNSKVIKDETTSKEASKVISNSKQPSGSSSDNSGMKVDKFYSSSLPAFNELNKGKKLDISSKSSKHGPLNFPSSEALRKHSLKLPSLKKRKRSPTSTSNDGPLNLAMSPTSKTKLKHESDQRSAKTPASGLGPPLKKISIKELMNTNNSDPKARGTTQKILIGGSKKSQLENVHRPLFDFGLKGSSLIASLPKIPKTSSAQSIGALNKMQGKSSPNTTSVLNSNADGKAIQSQNDFAKIDASHHHQVQATSNPLPPCKTDIFPSPDLFRRLAKNLGMTNESAQIPQPPSHKSNSPAPLPKIKVKLSEAPPPPTKLSTNQFSMTSTPLDFKDPSPVGPSEFSEPTPKSIPGTLGQSSITGGKSVPHGKFGKKSSLSAVIDKLKSAGSGGTANESSSSSTVKTTADFGGKEHDETLNSVGLYEDSTESSRSTLDHSFSDPPTTPDKSQADQQSLQPGIQPAIKMTITKRTNSDGSLEIVSSVVKQSSVSNVTTQHKSRTSSPCQSANPSEEFCQPKFLRDFSGTQNFQKLNSAWELGDIDDRRQQQQQMGLMSSFASSPAPLPPSIMGMLGLGGTGSENDMSTANAYFYPQGVNLMSSLIGSTDQDERTNHASKDVSIKGFNDPPKNEDLGVVNVNTKASPRIIDDDLMDEALMSSSLN